MSVYDKPQTAILFRCDEGHQFYSLATHAADWTLTLHRTQCPHCNSAKITELSRVSMSDDCYFVLKTQEPTT